MLNIEGKFVFGYNGYIPLNISCAAFSFVFGFICFCISMDRLRGLEIFDEQKKKAHKLLIDVFMSTAVKTKSLVLI